MPAKDSQYSYVHMTSPHLVLYREKWINDKLPFDDIDFNSILLQQQQRLQFQDFNFLKTGILNDEDEDDEYNVPVNQTQFGVTKNRKKLLSNNVWRDLDLQNFLDEHADRDLMKDHTILKPVNSAVYQSQTDASDDVQEGPDQLLEDERLEEMQDFILQDDSGDTVMNGNESSTTPLMTRTRKRDYYQTPVGRILR